MITYTWFEWTSLGTFLAAMGLILLIRFIRFAPWKKIAGYLPTWTLYWTMRLASWFLWKFRDLEWEWVYDLYQWTSWRSCTVQDWAGLSKPWSREDDEDDN